MSQATAAGQDQEAHGLPAAGAPAAAAPQALSTKASRKLAAVTPKCITGTRRKMQTLSRKLQTLNNGCHVLSPAQLSSAPICCHVLTRRQALLSSYGALCFGLGAMVHVLSCPQPSGFRI